MRLLAVAQLQAVLQVAQELVSVGKVVEVFAADVLLVVELLQSKHRPPRTQPRFATAIDTLQALHQEFNIANATTVELHIDAALARLLQQALAAVASDFLARGERRLDGKEVQFGTINERLYPAHKLPRQPHIARGMAHLDHGLQLPIMGHVRVIMDRMGQRDRGLAFVALWTQAQIDAKDRSLTSVAGEQFRGLLCQPDEVFPIGNLRSPRVHTALVEIQKSKVGTVI